MKPVPFEAQLARESLPEWKLLYWYFQNLEKMPSYSLLNSWYTYLCIPTEHRLNVGTSLGKKIVIFG